MHSICTVSSRIRHKVTSRYQHDSVQKLDALVQMLAEPAKSVIADCYAISDLAVVLDIAWETLHGTYGYVTTNVAS